jgi:cytochrome P450
MTLCIAGFETTGVTLSWLLYELSKNEQLQIDLRAEVRRHQGISMADYLAADNTLLAATVLETLRTHPAIPAVVREVAEEFDLGGRAMCPGDQIVLAIEQMHRAAFSEGELFLPQRWLTRKPETGIATFGGGAKVCPGRAIAMQEARLLTAILVSRFAFESTLRTTGHIRKGSVSATPKDGMVLRVTRIADF